MTTLVWNRFHTCPSLIPIIVAVTLLDSRLEGIFTCSIADVAVDAVVGDQVTGPDGVDIVHKRTICDAPVAFPTIATKSKYRVENVGRGEMPSISRLVPVSGRVSLGGIMAKTSNRTVGRLSSRILYEGSARECA